MVPQTTDVDSCAPTEQTEMPSIGKPKRNLSAYNLFYMQERAKIYRENAMDDKKSGFAGMTRNIAQKWKRIDPRILKNLKDLAAEDRVRYKKERKQYEMVHGKEKKVMDAAKPKRNRSAYNFFFIEERARINNECARDDRKPGFAGLTRNIAKKWKHLDPRIREYMNELAAEDKVRYKEEMKQYHMAQEMDKINAFNQENGQSISIDQSMFTQTIDMESFAPIEQKEMPSINKPKRNRSAYNFFFMEERARIYRESAIDEKKPGFEGLTRRIAKKWKNLDPQIRQHMNNLAAEDRVRYKEEMRLCEMEREMEAANIMECLMGQDMSIDGTMISLSYDVESISTTREKEASSVDTMLDQTIDLEPFSLCEQKDVSSIVKPKRNRSAYNFFFVEERTRIYSECATDEKERGFEGLTRNIAKKWKNLDPKIREKMNNLEAEDKVRYKKEMKQYKIACEIEARNTTNRRNEQNVSMDQKMSSQTIDMKSFSSPKEKAMPSIDTMFPQTIDVKHSFPTEQKQISTMNLLFSETVGVEPFSPTEQKEMPSFDATFSHVIEAESFSISEQKEMPLIDTMFSEKIDVEHFSLPEQTEISSIDKPKQNRSAYNIFFIEELARAHREYAMDEKKLDFEGLTRNIAKKWKHLDLTIRRNINKLAAEDKVRFEKEKKQYQIACEMEAGNTVNWRNGQSMPIDQRMLSQITGVESISATEEQEMPSVDKMVPQTIDVEYFSPSEQKKMSSIGIIFPETISLPEPKKKPSIDKPKQNRSAYNFFFQKERARIYRECARDGKQPSFEGLTRDFPMNWTYLDPKIRENMNKLAAEDKARYQKEMEQFKKAREIETRNTMNQVNGQKMPIDQRMLSQTINLESISATEEQEMPSIDMMFPETIDLEPISLIQKKIIPSIENMNKLAAEDKAVYQKDTKQFPETIDLDLFSPIKRKKMPSIENMNKLAAEDKTVTRNMMNQLNGQSMSIEKRMLFQTTDVESIFAAEEQEMPSIYTMFPETIDVEYISPSERKRMQSIDMSFPETINLESISPIEQKKKPSINKKPRKKPSIDKDKPKQNRSAYNFFYQEERARIYREGVMDKKKPGFAGLTRNIAKKWKDLDPTTRENMNKLAAEDKARYQKEMKQYKKARDMETRNIMNQLNGQKMQIDQKMLSQTAKKEKHLDPKIRERINKLAAEDKARCQKRRKEYKKARGMETRNTINQVNGQKMPTDQRMLSQTINLESISATEEQEMPSIDMMFPETIDLKPISLIQKKIIPSIENTDKLAVEDKAVYQKETKQFPETIDLEPISPSKQRKMLSTGKPKRNLSAYNFFFKQERTKVKREDGMGEIKPPKLTQNIAKKWKHLDPKIREIMNNLAAEDKVRYRKEMIQYEIAREIETKKLINQLNGENVSIDQTVVPQTIFPKPDISDLAAKLDDDCIESLTIELV